MANIDELLEKVAPVERTVEICIRGDLAGEMQQAERDLAEARAYDDAHNEPNRAPAIAARLEALADEAAAATVVFRLRSLGFRGWQKLIADHPPSEEQREAGYVWDTETFPSAAIVASVADPPVTAAQVEQLAERLSFGQWNRLVEAVLGVNMGADRLPKSDAATEMLRASAPSSTTASPSGSLTASS